MTAEQADALDHPPALWMVREEPASYGDTGEEEARRPSLGELAGGVRHARIPFTVMRCPELSQGATLLYGWLQHHMHPTRGCFPSHQTLAAELRCAERSVRTYLTELERAGFVRHTRGGASGNHYDLYPAGDAPESGSGLPVVPAISAGFSNVPSPQPADIAGMKPGKRPNPAKSRHESGSGLPVVPADIAGFGTVDDPNPAINDSEPGSGLPVQPAKNSTHIKEEPNPVNQTQLTRGSAPSEREPSAPPAVSAAEKQAGAGTTHPPSDQPMIPPTGTAAARPGKGAAANAADGTAPRPTRPAVPAFVVTPEQSQFVTWWYEVQHEKPPADWRRKRDLEAAEALRAFTGGWDAAKAAGQRRLASVASGQFCRLEWVLGWWQRERDREGQRGAHRGVQPGPARGGANDYQRAIQADVDRQQAILERMAAADAAEMPDVRLPGE